MTTATKLSVERFFTREDEDPYSTVEWELRDAKVGSGFEQKNVEFPASWSQTATNIVAQKYFRGRIGTPEREWSLKQLIGRVVGQITRWGIEFGYFDEETARVFSDELTYISLHQYAAFNSPVQFNIGAEGRVQTPSACFILDLQDNMESIKEWISTEADIFRAGSGSGVNVSRLREDGAPLSRGGTSSGPLSFMRWADSGAGAVKSGGTCLASSTRVYTASGPIAVEDLVGKRFVTFSYDPPTRRYKAKWARAFKSGHKQVVRVTTDKGYFDLSWDHPVRLATGEYRIAADLTKGTPLFACVVGDAGKGYLRMNIRRGKRGEDNRIHIHDLVAMDILGEPHKFPEVVIDHIDENKHNNDPSNLFPRSQSSHAKRHNGELVTDKRHVFQLQAFPHNGANNGMHRNSSFWDNLVKVANYKEKQSRILSKPGRAAAMQKKAARVKMLNTGWRLLVAGYSIDTFEEYIAARKQVIGPIDSASNIQKKFKNQFGGYESYLKELAANNHRVIAVEALGDMIVFDVEVECPTENTPTPESGHNFVIWPTGEPTGSGIAVHNTRRAAKMVIMDIDHPDIEEFIECKAREERKIRALRAAGFEVDFDGKDTHTLGFQNANNSVRVSDEFLHAVEDNEDWNLISRWDERVTKTVKARELMRKIAEAAWACADPGLQFDTTINNWNTTPSMGRLEASNPCLTGDTMVSTNKGDVMFRDLLVAVKAGEDVLVWSYGVSGVELCKPSAVMVTGVNELIYIELSNGFLSLKCTPDHKILTNNRGWIEAQNLRPDDQIVTLRKEDGKWKEELAYVVKKSRPTVREITYDLTEPKNHSFIANGVVVHNCAEHIRRNNSSCNLASINLIKFLREDGEFNISAFRQVVRVVYTAMDIMISGGEFPTEKITKVTHQDRDLGLGYCNLGALLMAQGLPYDSDEGRAWAAGITSLMTGLAYERSTELAEVLGPHPTFETEAGTRVMHMHARAAGEIHNMDDRFLHEVINQARETWRNVFERTEQVGLRNAQASVIAPTGTISFLMDATTTGMEPEFALVKLKKLVGGGTISTTNPMMGRGLKALGYKENDIAEILAYVNEHSTVVNAPGLDPSHYPVFATSMGDNSIAPMGHVKMMAAIQPGLAGSMSKTVNLPSTATVDDVYGTYMEAWRLGIKCIALYVEGSKVAEPMTATKKTSEAAQTAPTPTRRRLPRKRPSDTTSFRIKDPTGSVACEGYMNAGRHPDDGKLGEIFVKVSKQGSTLAGVMDAFAIAVSLGLQYGVPLDVFVSKFVNMRFEPSGGVDDPDFLGVTSIMDYLFRALARDYLSLDDRQKLNVLTISDRKALGSDMVQAGSNGHEKVEEIKTTSASSVDAPLCYSCGVKMQRAGTCYVCESCGSTSGCS